MKQPLEQWPADHIERRPITSLMPHARNSRLHSERQIGQIAASMLRWGWTMPVLCDEEGGIIAGHGRVRAAMKLGYEEVPCVIAHGWDDAKKRAYIIADNKLTINGAWDDDILLVELKELSELGIELEAIGFTQKEYDKLAGTDKNLYTSRLGAPIYTPSDKAPHVDDLIDYTKVDELTQEITEAKLPTAITDFLLQGAQRHAVFNYALIADYYAHANPIIRALMEKSALVIIDYDSAVENGFVKLTSALDIQLTDEYPAA